MAMAKQDILILYHGLDAEQWKDYSSNLIGSGLGDIQCEWINIKDGINMDIMQHNFHLLTLFVSPQMLDTLELDLNKDSLREFINGYKHIAVIRLSVSEADFLSVVRGDYDHVDKWTLLEITNNEGENQTMISKLMDSLQTARIPPSPSPRPSTSHKRPSKVVKTICPEKVKTAGEPVLLVFHKAYEHETVQVSMDTEEASKIDTTKLNPYCYQFTAPAHISGSAKVYVYVDGKKATRMTLRYASPSLFAYTMPEYLCQALNINPDVNQGEDSLRHLDKKLAQIFNSSLLGDNSLEYILSPKHVCESSDGRTSKDFLPTLLHFACNYGLQDLCSSVMDTPCSSSAFRIENCEGKNPLDLAREGNHSDLVEYIEIFMEMQDYIGLCGDIYEKMTNQPLCDGYLYMGSGNREVVDDYDQGRIPDSGKDGGYVVADQQRLPGRIEEVPEDEDICEDVKPKVPDRKTKPKPECSQNAKTLRMPPTVPNPPTDPIYPVDEEFFKPIPLSPNAMGSTNMEELIEYQEQFKNHQLNLNDIEKLYESWMQRNRNNLTGSLKERKARIDQMKQAYCKPELNKQKQPFFGKPKKQDYPDLNIQHNVLPNDYTIFKPGLQFDGRGSNRDSGSSSNRDSTNSFSSVGSRDSTTEGLGMIRERSFTSDSDEPNNSAPPVPRRNTNPKVNKGNRKSLGEEYKENIRNVPRTSRLPPIPKPEPIRNKNNFPPKPPKRP